MTAAPFHLTPGMERDYCMSIGVRAGDLVFIGGLTSVDEAGNETHADDAALQFKVIYEQMERVLAAHGGSASDVVSETIYYSCTGQEYSERLFPHRKNFYRDCHGPSVAGVQVAGFISPAIRVEVTCVAYIPIGGVSFTASPPDTERQDHQ
ncbi:RidA family protein [Sphingomonas aquatilis]